MLVMHVWKTFLTSVKTISNSNAIKQDMIMMLIIQSCKFDKDNRMGSCNDSHNVHIRIIES